jgi:putative MATE family efflux protein
VRFFSKKDLSKLIIPLIFEQILGVTVGMADTIMVSSVGETAMAGVSLVDTINILLINLFASFATGGAVVAARYLGQKDKAKACSTANQLLLSITSISIIVMIFSLVGNRSILRMVFGNVEHEVMQNAVVYFYLTALSFPFIAIYSGSAALCRSMGNSKISLKTSILVNLTNIGGNAIFIYGFHRGADGVGAATLLSRMVGAIIMLLVIHDQKRAIHIDAKFRLRFYPDIIKKIFRIGIPTGIDNCIFQIGKIMVQSLVAGLGTAAMAANAVVNTVSGFVVIPASSIGIALITVVGQTLGARAYGDAKYYIAKLVKIAYLAMAILNIGVILFSKQIISLYHLSPDASAMAWKILISYSICATTFWPTGFTLPSALRAADDAKFTMVVSIFSMWTWRVGLSFILAKLLGMGLYGTWIAMYVDWVFRSICFVVRIVRGKWIKKEDSSKSIASQ